MVQSYYKKKYKKKYQKKRASYARRRAPARRSSYRRRARRPRVGRTSMGSNLMPQYLLANLNPFDQNAFGVRIPDTSCAPSSGFHLREEYTLAVNAGTDYLSGAAYMPDPLNWTNAATGTGTGACSWAYASVATWAKKLAVQTSFQLVRPVAHGIRLSCANAPTSQTGNVHVCLCANSTALAAPTLPGSISEMREMTGYRRQTLASLTQTPMLVVNKFMDSTANRYLDPTISSWVSQSGGGSLAGAASTVAEEWMTIVVLFDGTGAAATTPELTVEVICHFEGQMKKGSFNGDSNAEPSNARILDATAFAVANCSPTFLDNGSDVHRHMADGIQRFNQMASGSMRPHGVSAGYTGNGGAGGLSGITYPARLAEGSGVMDTR